jgi:hypothetical protein
MFGLTAAFLLAGLFKGTDESYEALDAWYRYAQLFAFLAIGWCAISRPVPSALGTMNSLMVAYIAAGVAGAAGLIGLLMGLSNDNSTFLTGLSFQSVGLVVALLIIAWFLGMRREAK